ncbi:1,5-anhydro-D-fructose reductase [Allorhodopirellula heiligendammensis]|uniref:1,5-anhydro-D-fructose reductase n=2 Tax=Allorhodopirellula heiligendammensis TaxID=2714739 RepID=A0A5C6BD48_9BACT|nr:1,5-anhydro-D-fructose reductase [Allorhodopirellula heiligendammensis]
MTIRWGLIGVGDIANKRVAAAIQADPLSDLVAVCRRSEAQLHDFADQFSVPGRFTNADDLLAIEDLDAVYIATPVDCHLPQTIAAAAAGKHVLVEKPMALDPDQCDQMIAACDQANVQLGVAYYRRFYPVVQRIKQLLDAGKLGRILSIACVTGNPNRFPADDWRVICARGGGGPLMDIGSHRIDVFLQLMGDIDAVQSSMMDAPDFEAEQVATVMLGFQNGAHGVLQCFFGTINSPDRLEIIGTDGRITVEDLNQGDLTLFTADGVTVESHPPASNLHRPLIEEFSQAVSENRSPAISGRTGRKTNEIMQRAYEHDRSRRAGA